MILEIRDIGLRPYKEVWNLQDDLRQKRQDEKIPNALILCEHNPVFTLGKRDCSGDILSPKEIIKADGIEVVQTNRGGKITYHGPGQPIGYFICTLNDLKLGIKAFVNAIEEMCIRTLRDFDLDAQRSEVNPGVWIGNKKIAAIGLNISHGVTQHGFALNASPNLSHYRHVIACGLKDFGVTSMEKELGCKPDPNKIKESIIKNVSAVFNVDITCRSQS